MGIADQVKAARAPGKGAKGLAEKGVFYCSRCGKRGHKEASIQQHVRDLHGGEGEVLKEPTRRQMMRALLAAEEMATDLSIAADNAAHAAKTDPRWEGVAEKLRARVSAFREASA